MSTVVWSHWKHVTIASAAAVALDAWRCRRRSVNFSASVHCSGTVECLPGHSVDPGIKTSNARARAIAKHGLLVDLALVKEARAVPLLLPGLLESFWLDLAAASLPTREAELMLHRLAEKYGHGTLRYANARNLADLLLKLGVHSVLDPMANTGLHARLLMLAGLIVEAADVAPPWASSWAEVAARPVGDTCWEHYNKGWALFLSWPPHWSEAGHDALVAFKGDAVVLLGDQGGWTGTEGLREELRQHWTCVASWPTDPPWPRVEECLTVFVRKSIES